MPETSRLQQIGPPTAIGLTVALAGPGLLAELFKHAFGPHPSWQVNVVAQLGLWTLLGGLAAVCVRWEQQPLSSFGMRAPRSSTLLWASALVVLLELVVAPALLWVVGRLGLPGLDQGFETILAWPLPVRVTAVITAGVIEEALYHGYGIERLSLATHNVWLSAFLTSLALALVHFPFWGAGPTLITFFTGGTLAVFYAWKRDLPACMLAHAVGDGMGFVVLPLLHGH